MRTNLTEARRVAAQALAERAIEFGYRHGLNRTKIEEQLGLHGNPLGQLLSEYLRGETAPSLAGLQRLENRVAALENLRPRVLQIALVDPYYECFYEEHFFEDEEYSLRKLSSKAPPLKFVILAENVDGVTSRKLSRDFDEDDLNWVCILADGFPLRPECHPPGAHFRKRLAAGKMPESRSNALQSGETHGKIKPLFQYDEPCNTAWIEATLNELVCYMFGS